MNKLINFLFFVLIFTIIFSCCLLFLDKICHASGWKINGVEIEKIKNNTVKNISLIIFGFDDGDLSSDLSQSIYPAILGWSILNLQ